MSTQDTKLTDSLLKHALAGRAGGTHTSAELVGDVLAAVESLPQGRRWRLDLARYRLPIPGLVGIALLLAALAGAALVGARLVTNPLPQPGVIAYTTGAWSWDGRPIVDGLALSVVSPDGGEPTRLVDVPGEPLPSWHVHEELAGQDVRLGPAVRWSPDGARIAFRLYNDQAGLYVMNRNGSGLRLVADATGERSDSTDQFNSSFAWSPDGSRIAFISPDLPSPPPSNPRNGRLYVVDVENGGVQVLIERASGSVAWSPDGSTIAFGRSLLPTSELVLVNADGTGERSFRYTYLERNHPGSIAWSPNGSTIAFVQERFPEAGSGDYLMVVSADGNDPREVGHWNSGCCYHGAFGGVLEWSPDGTLIATYAATDTIFVFAADGSGERMSLTGYHVDWSPDGSQLVFSGLGPAIPGAPDNGSTAIYVIDADGTNQRWLADGDYPAWSP